MKMKIKPLGDRVLVEPLEDREVVKGGIVIPYSAKEKPQEAKVVAVGAGKKDEDGKIIPIDEVKVGDIVLTSKYGGTEVKVDDKEYKILNLSDILAIVG
jgi:chaperonin GroES